MACGAVDILDIIGGTPMVKINNVGRGTIHAKAEFLNPGGSVKDRVALHIMREATRTGQLKPGDVIVEATSGNTGIGFALVGNRMGHRVIIVMPENMSDERKKLIQALGAELVLTPADESLTGCLNKVREIADSIPNAFVPNQFANPLNPEAHYRFTGQEIWQQCGECVDVFVSGIGSGGTIMGVARFLKERNPRVQIVAVEPKASAALLGREPGLHAIQGIGDGFVPPVVDRDIIDMVMTVSDEDAIETTRRLAREEGILVGTSSGANVFCASQVAGHGRVVVTILPDRAERYFSTALI